jgi:hypothetical protein
MMALLSGSFSLLGGMFISARMLCSLPLVVVVVVDESGAVCRSVCDPCVSPMGDVEACRRLRSEVCPNVAASKSGGFRMPAPDDEEDADEVDGIGVMVVGEMDSGVKTVPSSAPAVTGTDESRDAGMDPVKRDSGILDRSKLSNTSRLRKTSWNGKRIILWSSSCLSLL